VAIFSVGFLIRPLGAFFFGWLGEGSGGATLAHASPCGSSLPDG
jgi:hypothetical protein